MDNTNYIGDELEIFSHAHNWKNYWGSFVRPYLGARVLEVGAGLGGTTLLLNTDPKIEEWICLEPDPKLSIFIEKMKEKGELPTNSKVFTQTLDTYTPSVKFDSVLYIDVIEHIEDDKSELERAKKVLKNGGYLIIVVPAHQYLFSPFDKAIGHFRRYSRANLKSVIPEGFEIEKAIYLDSLGLMASLTNKLFLKQDYPTLPQVKFWDNYIVTTSKILDKITGHHLGKSVLLIAKLKN